jgi:putative ABC transport system permease protein
MDVAVTDGALNRMHGHGIAVRNDSAPDLGAVGDRIDLLLGDGTPVRATIVATYDRGLGFGDVLLPRSMVDGHTTQGFDETVFIDVEEGRDAQVTADSLRASLSGTDSVVTTRAGYIDSIADDAAQKARELYVLLGVIIVFCGIAIVNALNMSIGDRTKEFALLRLVGASRRQVRRMVRAETIVIVGFGTALGVLVSAPTVAVLSHSLTGRLVPSAPATVWIGAALTLVALGFAAGVPATRRALRNDPLGTIGGER